MPRITIRFALIALLLAAIVPTATGIGVSAYLNSRATVELLWHDLADEMIEDARQKVLRYVESGTAQLRLSKLLTDEGLVDPANREGLLKYLHRCLLAHPNVTWCSYADVDGAYLAAYREPGGKLRLTLREQDAGGTHYRDYRVGADGSYKLILDTIGKFDPRTRPWWPVAEHATGPAWSEPFLFASRRQPGVVLVERQDGKDGKMSGVWLMEYELSAIAKYLREIRESAGPGGGPQSHTDVEQGTVDKFIGDAIMAFWGAPHEVADHALAACKAGRQYRLSRAHKLHGHGRSGKRSEPARGAMQAGQARYHHRSAHARACERGDRGAAARQARGERQGRGHHRLRADGPARQSHAGAAPRRSTGRRGDERLPRATSRTSLRCAASCSSFCRAMSAPPSFWPGRSASPKRTSQRTGTA